MVNGDGWKINSGMLTIIALLVVQLIAFSFGYGVLNEQVKTNKILIEQSRILQVDVQSKLGDFNARLIAIEIILKSK